MESNKTASPKKNASQKKKKKKKSSGTFLNILKVFLILMIVGGLLGSGIVYFYVTSVLKDIEPIDPTLIEKALTENSVIVDGEGRVLEQIQNKNGLRTIVRYNDISKNLINAFVAVEDKTFWTHNGFNFIRLFGAVKDTLTSGKRLGGTSTITQQLARNVYLPDTKNERSIDRKIKEAYYAIELEKHLKKEQIIEGYLNLIYLGSSANGVEAAAQTYFSKSAKDLDLVEAAMLAGVPKSPKKYAPMTTKNKENVTPDDYILDDSNPLFTIVFNPSCEDRYKLVILLMRNNGYLTDEEYQAAKNVDLKTKLHPSKSTSTEISSYFSDMVKDDVLKDLSATYGYTYEQASNILYTKGLVIHSTIDFDMQKILESNYDADNFTSYFGESTYAAVKAFQKKYNLSADGIAGQGTIAKIGEVTGMDTSVFTQKLYKKGSDGEEVILLKKALYGQGFLRNNENFPRVTVTFNKEGNIISEETRNTILYKQSNFVNDNDQLMIPSSDYKFDDQGNLVLFKNKRLNFYAHKKDDQLENIQVVVKNTFTYNEDASGKSSGKKNIEGLYTYEGRDVFIPNEYKSYDADRNVVIDKAFLAKEPDFFKLDGNQTLLIDKNNYYISPTGIIQPQSAMVIIDYHTGQLKAIVGGRNISGQKIYNRAINPRQPGSSIKPLSVYTPAIDSLRYTVATPIDDRPMYLNGNPSIRWPYNWYEHSSRYAKHWGLVTLRKSMQYSINTVAAFIANDLGVDTCIDYLKRFGITSLVTEGGTSDMNLSAVSMGGMTKGVSPLEMTNAYGAIANKGVLTELITYTSVENNKGETILENNQTKEVVVDEKVAYVVQDMMKSTVTSGIASSARISPNNNTIPVAGKTGTTSNKMDAWFIGFTPYYVAGVWFGNDVNMPLDQGSGVSALFWKTVMSEIHADLEPKQFERPSGIVTSKVDTMSGKLPTDLSYMDPRNTVISEIFIKGTEPTEEDDVHVAGSICLESGKLATPNCPTTLVENRVFVKRPIPYVPEENLDNNGNPIILGDWIYELPTEECDIHNSTIIDTFDYSNYEGVTPTIKFADGSTVVQRPFFIELNDGQKVLLPIGTKILTDNSILFPDASTIPAYMIKFIPAFTTEDLDRMNPTPSVDDAIQGVDDNSNISEDSLNTNN